jgi:hypothetical protein
MGDVLDALSSGIAKFAANEPETVGDGPPYSKIMGRVLYQVKDMKAHEEACLIRKVF